MTATYFKRYTMQFDLREAILGTAALPTGYSLVPWSSQLIEQHALAKFESFCNELDSNVFPCLGELEGCRRLMKEISCRQGFIPSATWLVTYQDPVSGEIQNCGTVQGIREQVDVGSIQNLGLAPVHRGKGIGTTLLNQALAGFKKSGIGFVRLEVTSQNLGALRLYERLGFETVRTVYKSIDLSYA